jgi:hypothetical protein
VEPTVPVLTSRLSEPVLMTWVGRVGRAEAGVVVGAADDAPPPELEGSPAELAAVVVGEAPLAVVVEGAPWTSPSDADPAVE